MFEIAFKNAFGEKIQSFDKVLKIVFKIFKNIYSDFWKNIWLNDSFKNN